MNIISGTKLSIHSSCVPKRSLGRGESWCILGDFNSVKRKEEKRDVRNKLGWVLGIWICSTNSSLIWGWRISQRWEESILGIGCMVMILLVQKVNLTSNPQLMLNRSKAKFAIFLKGSPSYRRV